MNIMYKFYEYIYTLDKFQGYSVEYYQERLWSKHVRYRVNPDWWFVLARLRIILVGTPMNSNSGFTLEREWQAAQRAAEARGTESGIAGMYTRVAQLSASLSVPLKWASTWANPAAQCRYGPALHALFFQAAQTRWPIRVAILFTSDRFPLPGFRSRTDLVERQIRIRVVNGCRLPDAEEIVHAGSALCRWNTGSWRPLWAVLKRQLSEHFGKREKIMNSKNYYECEMLNISN